MDEGTTGDYLHIRGLPRMVTPCDTPREGHGKERSGELSPPWQKSGHVARAVRRQSVCKLALFNNMADKEESDSDIEVLLLYYCTRDEKPEEGPVNTGYMTSFCKDHNLANIIIW